MLKSFVEENDFILIGDFLKVIILVMIGVVLEFE